MTIRCLLGFHNWEYQGEFYYNTMIFRNKIFLGSRICRDCNKKQRKTLSSFMNKGKNWKNFPLTKDEKRDIKLNKLMEWKNKNYHKRNHSELDVRLRWKSVLSD